MEENVKYREVMLTAYRAFHVFQSRQPKLIKITELSERWNKTLFELIGLGLYGYKGNNWIFISFIKAL